MKHFEEVNIVHQFDQNHPYYEKPDIGTKDVRIYKQFICWDDIRSCMEAYENPNKWTRIFTHLGMSIIDMPYEEVCNKILAARELLEQEYMKDIVAYHHTISKELKKITSHLIPQNNLRHTQEE